MNISEFRAWPDRAQAAARITVGPVQWIGAKQQGVFPRKCPEYSASTRLADGARNNRANGEQIANHFARAANFGKAQRQATSNRIMASK